MVIFLQQRSFSSDGSVMTLSVLLGCSAAGLPVQACDGLDPGTVRTRCGPGRTACPAGPAPSKTLTKAPLNMTAARKPWTPPAPWLDLQERETHAARVQTGSRSTPEVLLGAREGLSARRGCLGTFLLRVTVQNPSGFCSCHGAGKQGGSGASAGSGADTWGCWGHRSLSRAEEFLHEAWSSSSAASSCEACTCSWGSRWCAGPSGVQPPACRDASQPRTWTSTSFLK